MRSHPYVSQEQLRREIVKRNKLGDKVVAAASPEKGNHEERLTSLADKAAAATKTALKGNHEGR